MGHNDYFDNQNKGKFLKYFKQHEYDINGLDDELGECSAFNECAYVKFEIFKDFPLPDTIQNDDEIAKQKEIFRILQHCYQYDMPPQLLNIESFEPMLSSGDEIDDDTKYSDDTLKIENDMLWKKVETLNTKIDELNYEMKMLKDEKITFKQKTIKLQSDYDKLSKKYKQLLEKQKNDLSMIIDERNFVKWNCEIVISWINQLDDGKYKRNYNKLSDKIKEENIVGKYLIALDKNDLHRLSVTDFGDKIAILEHINRLKQFV